LLVKFVDGIEGVLLVVILSLLLFLFCAVVGVFRGNFGGIIMV